MTTYRDAIQEGLKRKDAHQKEADDRERDAARLKAGKARQRRKLKEKGK